MYMLRPAKYNRAFHQIPLGNFVQMILLKHINK
ncbi:GSCOCG00009391001-RA-CDS [Cotesia congregata]|nr:GSCOCG00009391001-RA-CDS [Cotesia congregata]